MTGVRAASWLEKLLWTNIVMAASAVGWVVVTSRVLEIPIDLPLCLLAFCACAAFYTMDRLGEREWENDRNSMPRRTTWVMRHAAVLKLVVGAEFLVAIFALATRPVLFPVIILGAVIGLGYSVRLPSSRWPRLGFKYLPGAKAFFVAALWCVLVVVAPALSSGTLTNSALIPLMLSVGALVTVQITINDIRDMRADDLADTRTLPVLLGDRATRVLGVGFLFTATVSGAIAGSPALLVAVAYTLAALLCYSSNKDETWRPWIEGQGIPPAVAALIVTH